MHIVIEFLLLVIGFTLLVKGADWFVDGACGIAKRFGIPQLIIGLTIVAMGTSAPEAAVSITAAVKNNAEITIGNVVGSNILNILIILGLSAVIVPLAVAGQTVRFEIPLVIFSSVLLLLIGFDGQLGILDGMVLWIVFFIYLGYLFYMAKRSPNSENNDVNSNKITLKKSILFTLLGLVMIIWGSDISVSSASEIARYFGISERFIGLTIVALGTSLPELFTSVNAARKKNADIAIGNIVGSNIFNILFVVGTSAIITPVPFADGFVIDTIVSIAAAIILLVCTIRRKKLTRWSGIVMLILYCVYFAYLTA